MERFDKKELSQSERRIFEWTQRVRFQDIDAAGIVFFARFFDYVHGAYEAWLGELGLPLARVLQGRLWAAPLRHVECDYFAPARFGDELCIVLARAAVEESEISLGWVVRNANRPAIAVVQTVHTFVDPATFRRVSVPSEVQAALRAGGAPQ